MSDAFLVMISDDLKPSQDIARGLLLSDKEADEILKPEIEVADGLTIMKVCDCKEVSRVKL